MFILQSHHLFVTFCFLLLCVHESCSKVPTETLSNTTADDAESARKYNDMTVQLEKTFKGAVKGAVRGLLPSLIKLNEATDISADCISSLLKYLRGLNQAKTWAVKMLDASSKLPPGFLSGTFADYGSFDECLGVELPKKEGSPFFRGSSCALEARPPLPHMPEKYSLVESKINVVNGTLGSYFRDQVAALHHKKLRLVICVPSTCSLQDMRHVMSNLINGSDFYVKIPQCYTKGKTEIHPVHLALLSCLSLLFIMCVIGSIVDWKKGTSREQSALVKGLVAFSIPSNFNRLVSPSAGSSELKCIHGIRALGMCWVVLGHTYVLMDFELLKDPSEIQNWFRSVEFELVHNGWLAVEVFFLLGGMLVSYGGMRAMQISKGSLNVPLLTARRLIRLTPPLLLLMGLVFALPLISWGPFWYEHIDPQVESCTQYWWMSLLYISNWFGIDKGCTITTWYLGVDFQLHVFSFFMLLLIYRHTSVGVSLLAVLVGISCAAIGAQTLLYDVMPAIQLSVVDDDKVLDALNKVHVYTLTHLGPHCIGMILGYHIFKHREQKVNKALVWCGWLMSVVLSLGAVIGGHWFSTGEERSVSLSVLYASLHRSLFIVGVAWVIYACVAGHGGVVNLLLSSTFLSPLSRLSFMVYLIHPLVIWIRLGSLRERHSTTHYDFVYTYLANLITSFVAAVPFYLLLEAPLSNLDRLIFISQRPPSDDQEKPPPEQSSRITTSL